MYTNVAYYKWEENVMNLIKARQIAEEKLKEYGLADWSFRYNNAKRQLGLCSFSVKTIYLSRPITELNNETRVVNTILHEVAHALVGLGHGHDEVWQAKAKEIGCTGDRLATENEGLPLVRIERPYIGTCPTCGLQFERFRVSTKIRQTGFHKSCYAKTGKAELLVWTKKGNRQVAFV